MKRTGTNRLLPYAVCVSLSFALVSVVRAHHSQSEYDLRGKVDVEGVVTEVQWKSPHAWIQMDVVDAKGQKVNWAFELPSPVTLMRRGWTRDSVKPGDRLKVTGAPARNHPAVGIANVIKDANGKPLFTGITSVNEGESAPPTK
jgi:hypothetical protein